MIKGGYKIVNLKDVNLITGSGSPVKIDGIYDAIENNYRKPILLSGIVIDGVEKADAFATLFTNGGNFVAFVYNKYIKITSDDMVSVANTL